MGVLWNVPVIIEKQKQARKLVLSMISEVDSYLTIERDKDTTEFELQCSHRFGTT